MAHDSTAATWLHRVLAGLLLTLMVVLAGGAALRESATIDEVAHIGAGVSYLQKLDLRLNDEHPPLAKVLAAAPAVIHGVRADYSDVSWTFSGKFFQGALGEWSFGHAVALRWNDPRSILVWTRAPMLLVTLLLGFVLYALGSRFGGPWGGLLSLAAYVSCPVFLAFGPLVITDTAVTLFVVLTMWALANVWRSPDVNSTRWFALALAGALLSKFSSGLLLIGFVFFSLSLRWLPLAEEPAGRDEQREWRRVRNRCVWRGIFVAAVIVYAVYFVLSWNQSTDFLWFLGSNRAALILRRLLMPPALYLRGLAIFVLQARRGTFILGHSYTHGVWFYFPVVFALKSPLAFLTLVTGAGGVALVARRRLGRGVVIPKERALHWRALWVFFLIFTLSCIFSPLTISIRHFSIPIVLMILGLAPLPRMLGLLRENGWGAARAVAVLVFLLACACLATVVRAYPYYFPFFNSLTFGRPGYALVNDSNLDWNQSLPDAQRFAEQHRLSHVLVAEYGLSDPSVIIPGAEFWNCEQPSPEDAGRWVVLSGSMVEAGHNCLWLLDYPHEAIAGGSMYVVRLPSEIPAAGAPGGPPLPADYQPFGGMAAPFDFQRMCYEISVDPTQLKPTFEKITATFAQARSKKK